MKRHSERHHSVNEAKATNYTSTILKREVFTYHNVVFVLTDC